MSKKRTGRPRTESPRIRAVAIRLSPDEHLAIQDAATRADRNISDWLRLKVRDWVRQHGATSETA